MGMVVLSAICFRPSTSPGRIDHFVYAPDKFYVGSLRVEKIPVVGGLIVDRLLAAMHPSEDVAAAWNRLGDVKLEGSQLQLVMP